MEMVAVDEPAPHASRAERAGVSRWTADRTCTAPNEAAGDVRKW